MPEKKAQDLGQKLAKRKSQDFKSKIEGWSDQILVEKEEEEEAQALDEVVVITGVKQKKVKADVQTPKKKSPKAIVVVNEAEDEVDLDPEREEDEVQEDAEKEPMTLPTDGLVSANKQAAVRKTSKEISAQRQAWVRRRSKTQKEIPPEVKQVTTPKKRVVSDGHWRRDRIVANKNAATPEKETPKEKDVTPKPVTIRRSVVSVGLKVAPVPDLFDDEPEPTRVKPLTKRIPSRSLSPIGNDREVTPDYEDSGFKVFINRKNGRKPADRAKKSDSRLFESASSATTVSFDRPSTATDITTPDQIPATKEKADQTLNGVKFPLNRRSPRTSGKLEKTPTQPTKSRNITPDPIQVTKAEADKPRETAKSGPKEPPRPIPRVFGKRIEGWLDAVPADPFTDHPDNFPSIEPLVLQRRVRRSVRDRVNDMEAGRERNDLHRSDRRQRSRPSLGQIDANDRSRLSRSPVDDTSDASGTTPTLKRRGARRSTQSPLADRTPRGVLSTYDSGRALPTLPLVDAQRYVPGAAAGRPSTGPRDQFSTVNRAERLGIYSQLRRDPVDAIPQLDGSLLSRASDGDEPRGQTTTHLKRRLTKHSDLVSVLSLSKDDGSAMLPRAMSSRRPKPQDLTIPELMNEVTADELKYQRELRTLVDGVIPVLLNYILKPETQRSSGPKNMSTQNGAKLTQPIVDMGIALERLKAHHRRIPMHNPNDLLTWADGASKVYEEYLKVWRLGYHDVVVNLAPADETARKVSWEQGLQRDSHGDLIKADGERVDVAYLLKRPLVRLKNLKRVLTGINQITPSPFARKMEQSYHKLVEEARARSNDERARLEDEGAAAIDATRARDWQNLAPLSGVRIDQTRSVRARDYFDMQLYHSTGQQLDCKIEVILRDDAPSNGSSGDVLFCEISATGRWLLFPPIPSHLVSSRKTNKDGEIVVMIRGTNSSGNVWRELMSLQAEDEQCVEWERMLGSNPLPPTLTRQSSFNALSSRPAPYSAPNPSDLTEDLHLPIGERPRGTARKWDDSAVDQSTADQTNPGIQRSARPSRYRDHIPVASGHNVEIRKNLTRVETSSNPRDYYDDRMGNGGRQTYSDRSSLPSRPGRTKSEYSLTSISTSSKKDYSVWLPSSDRGGSDESADEDDRPEGRRPSMRRRTSSVPSQELPSIPKLRKSSEPQTPSGKLTAGQSVEPRSAPAKLRESMPSRKDDSLTTGNPPSKSASSALKSSILPSLTPAFLKRHRRSSSPLKHEYEPSTGTESLSEDDLSDSASEISITSESSADEFQEQVSTLGDLRDFGKFGIPRPSIRQPSASIRSRGEVDPLGPSDSASQYRPSSQPEVTGLAKTVASIFCWSDSGVWASLHPQECEIVVTPGLIEAFDVAQAHQVSPNSANPLEPSPSQRGVKPLVALELTPLVPLRRGTALDISIRSPPTSNSLLRTGNHIMFRSRSPEECEKLYGFINRSRIDNPTWISLQNARGPVATSNWAGVMDRRNAERSSSGSWLKSFSRKSSTYRSTGTRAVSTAATDSSVGTMNSAFSALRRFSGTSRFFNIAKSTIMSREGTRSTGSDSLESGMATPIAIDPSNGTPVGITNAKIRLWFRENANKWRDLGTARLTILIPPRLDPSAPADPANVGAEKRILVTGKKQDDVLLDVTLPEASFERIARTGIAVSLWEDSAAVRATGGVLTSSLKVFMLQMKSVS